MITLEVLDILRRHACGREGKVYVHNIVVAEASTTYNGSDDGLSRAEVEHSGAWGGQNVCTSTSLAFELCVPESEILALNEREKVRIRREDRRADHPSQVTIFRDTLEQLRNMLRYKSGQGLGQSKGERKSWRCILVTAWTESCHSDF